MMMGFRFAENFNQPFLCMSLTEFWKRWHLTLSDFLRDYIFIPIAKTGWVTVGIASFLTMFLSGLWHGASFSFICFGVYFGVFMFIERKLGVATKIDSPYSFTRNMIAVAFVVMAMPFFITGNFSHSLEIYGGAIGFNGVGDINSVLIGTSKMTSKDIIKNEKGIACTTNKVYPLDGWLSQVLLIVVFMPTCQRVT